MRVLVLGAYGLIGTHLTEALCGAGHVVTGLGRDVAAAKRRLPHVRWRKVDIVNIKRPEQWANLLADQDAVVNCVGALQDGVRDDVTAVQETAMRALFSACAFARVKTVVQVSAVGASIRSATRFMRTKAKADAHLASLDLEWTILRPGLVVGPSAYGATALLRALASFPFVIPVLGGRQRIQTIHGDDVAKSVVAAIEGRVQSRRIYDLVEAETHTLEEVVVAMRAWLGFSPAPILRVPKWLGLPLLKIGDGLRWLGWRTPLCSTAFAELSAGVVGDPRAWREETGAVPATSLAVTLARIPSTVQERWFARAWLVRPVVVGTLSFLWIVSGAIALLQLNAAAAILIDHGVGRPLASAIALTGGVLDIVLGGALLIRGLCARAAQAMIALSLVYLGGATLLASDLWADPLGPLIKVIPAIVLTLVLLGEMPER